MIGKEVVDQLEVRVGTVEPGIVAALVEEFEARRRDAGMNRQRHGLAEISILNKDGTLNPEEMAAGIQGELKRYDTDANGTLSLDEFVVTWFNIGNQQTVPVLVWGLMRRGVDPSINAVATALFALLVTLVAASNLIGKRGAR